jgi:hypothetical protein
LSLMNFPRIPCVTLVLRRRQKFSSDEETDKEEGEEDFGLRRRREREGLRWRW